MAGVGLGTAAMVVEQRRPVKGSGSFEWRNAIPPRRQGLLKLAGKLYLISERASIVEERKMLVCLHDLGVFGSATSVEF